MAAFLVIEVYAGIENRARPGAMVLSPYAFIGSLAMFGLGLWDDFRPLGPKCKLAAQILICLAVCWGGIGVQRLKLPFSGHPVELGIWGLPLTVLWLVGLTNLINLIDGMDGLAAGVSFMLMVLLGYIGRKTANFELEASGLAGALLAFLYYNLPPARVYMGDGGAYFLGFQIGLLALMNSHKGEVCAALAVPMLVLTLPILDTVLSILRRGVRGLPICRADRCHLHHRLLRCGLSRWQVLLIFYGLTLILLLTGLGVYRVQVGWELGLLGIIALLVVAGAGGFSLRWDWSGVRPSFADAWRMRPRVADALRLVRLFQAESRRRASIDALWPDLVSMAANLGFVSLRLTLADETRQWAMPGFDGPFRAVEAPVSDTRFGKLQLGTPLQEVKARPSSDEGLFEIQGELLVEGWMAATALYLTDPGCGLSFSSRNLHLLGSPKPQRLKPCFSPALPADAVSPATSSRV